MNAINREAGEQGKGFRLQRLRAIKLLFDKMAASERAIIYAGTEYLDDVYINTIEHDKVETLTEGDKNYNPEKSFSFMSKEVKNSVVIFLDCWFQNNIKGLVFCFYTTVKIGKENNTQRTRKLGITLPNNPIIELLKNKKYDDEYLLPTVKAVLIDEYKTQYEGKEEEGYLSAILEMKDELWIDFLNRIDWKFEEEDELALEETIKEQIRNQSFYRIDFDGKESYVIAGLLDEFEKRQNIKDLFGRLIHDSLVRQVLLEVGNNQYKITDPVYKQWKQLDPSDNRNLEEKIESVTTDYNKKKLRMFARKVGAVKIELSKIDNKERGSYQYRIFDACEEKLLDMIEDVNDGKVEPSVVDKWIDELVDFSEIHLEEMSKDFTYAYQNKNTLRSTILELFDSCYLSFDG
ncbi:hypothetical protein ACQ4XT_02775 [Halobacillus faecis]